MNEIDLLIENNGTLYPLEMKKHSNHKKRDMSAFGLLDRLPNVQRGPGGVIYLYDNLATLGVYCNALPLNELCSETVLNSTYIIR